VAERARPRRSIETSSRHGTIRKDLMSRDENPDRGLLIPMRVAVDGRWTGSPQGKIPLFFGSLVEAAAALVLPARDAVNAAKID